MGFSLLHVAVAQTIFLESSLGYIRQLFRV